MALILLGLSVEGGQTQEIPEHPVKNALCLTQPLKGYPDPLYSMDLYTTVPLGATEFDISVYDGGQGLMVEVYDSGGNLICAKKGFSDDNWDTLAVPIKKAVKPETYRIHVGGELKSDEYPKGNIFWLDISTGTLYSYELQFKDAQDVMTWVEVPWNISEFCLSTYDMDNRGAIYITSPDKARYGPFKPSGYNLWSDIHVSTEGKGGLWCVEFVNLLDAGVFRVEAGGKSLKLHLSRA